MLSAPCTCWVQRLPRSAQGNRPNVDAWKNIASVSFSPVKSVLWPSQCQCQSMPASQCQCNSACNCVTDSTCVTVCVTTMCVTPTSMWVWPSSYQRAPWYLPLFIPVIIHSLSVQMPICLFIHSCIIYSSVSPSVCLPIHSYICLSSWMSVSSLQ